MKFVFSLGKDHNIYSGENRIKKSVLIKALICKVNDASNFMENKLVIDSDKAFSIIERVIDEFPGEWVG